jgi:hypothetical protein
MELVEELKLKSGSKRNELLAKSEKSLPEFIEECNARMRKSADLGSATFEITNQHMDDKLRRDGFCIEDSKIPTEVWRLIKFTLRDSLREHYTKNGFKAVICKTHGIVILRLP